MTTAGCGIDIETGVVMALSTGRAKFDAKDVGVLTRTIWLIELPVTPASAEWARAFA